MLHAATPVANGPRKLSAAALNSYTRTRVLHPLPLTIKSPRGFEIRNQAAQVLDWIKGIGLACYPFCQLLSVAPFFNLFYLWQSALQYRKKVSHFPSTVTVLHGLCNEIVSLYHSGLSCQP